MSDLILPIAIFSIWTVFSLVYIKRYKIRQSDLDGPNDFWNNVYLFEAIPPVFPTLGIFCTALGITIGLWDFDTNDIQRSIPSLLKGLRIAFIATMAGIAGLVIFQKYVAIVQKQIDDNPNRPKKQTDELSALASLNFAIENLRKDYGDQTDRLIRSIAEDLELRIGVKITSLEQQISQLRELEIKTSNSIDAESKTNELGLKETAMVFQSELEQLRRGQAAMAETTNKNTLQIINAIDENNKKTAKKFDEFSDLLRKNNTEALVDVMRNATELFNAQMTELIDRLIKENFEELNTSVQLLNTWQKENKTQIQQLTENFQRTHELFAISATTLQEVGLHTKNLVDDNGKLGQIVADLKKVMVDDTKFQDITSKLSKTVEVLKKTTDSFDETTSKLNDWVKTERNFKEAADILIVKLEEFRDLNGDVWTKYRTEMKKAVSIIKETSTTLNEDLGKINGEFYERLNDTLNNLDQCIQRFIPSNSR